MAKRYRRLRGDTAYYPFAARTGLRARQRRQVRWLRLLGVTALLVAAALTVRQTVFALAGVGLVALYNGQPGSKRGKWVFYVFYPAHLLALCALRLALGV